MTKVVYMAVTKDKYELPIAVADTTAELAKLVGVSRNAINSAISHAKKKGFNSCYVKVVIE